ncbi:MAG: hypothetical protein IKZ67_03940 [Paludibacteraceae bacterium]|nr:hypothetical protein [Paludibacteraceae bacterium]
MRKILLIIAALFTVMCASASNVEKIQFANAGKFSLGVMSGFPTFNGILGKGMPFISLDAMIGLKDGFCHTKRFGDNGAVDLGLYIGYAQNKFDHHDWVYNEDEQTMEDRGEYTRTSWAMPVSVRSAFHWEFVKNLDVYAGAQLGCSFYGFNDTPHAGGEMIVTGELEMFLCHYFGAKWMFTQHFGVKTECNLPCFLPGKRFVELNYPIASVGLQFNF